MTGQQLVITKLSNNGRVSESMEMSWVRARVGEFNPKEGTATMHKQRVQGEPKAENVEKRG